MKKKKLIVTGIINILVIALIIVVLVVPPIFDSILSSYLDIIGGTKAGGWAYSEYENEEELQAAHEQVSYDIMAEGAVLLRNENNALPLNNGASVSVFGQHAREILVSGSGSGSIGDPEQDLKTVLEGSGFKVNGTLWDFYLNNGGKSLGNGPALAGGNEVTDWSINEFPVSQYPANVKSSYSSYNDAAIVVISRTGGEGGDLAMDMSPYGGQATEHYLELSAEEKDLLTEVTNNFDKVIVLLNTNNTIELGFLEDYGVDACLYIGGVGMSGLSAVGDILNGTVNPSGHLGDTYVYDNFSSAAMQNFGDFGYSNNDIYDYVVYAEGIYVGYRYYETRYADVVTGAENAGDYNYDEVVAYPFGYGLSYTTFEWSDFSAEYDGATDSFTFTVTVKNTGEAAGKDVVQIYFQAPYIHGQTKIEKSAIELGVFVKTDLLAPQESKTYTATMAKRDLASYDEEEAKTFVLDEGDYYFTAARDAHEAVNNILAERGYEVEGSGLVDVYSQAAYDASTYSEDAYTKTKITNLFDFAEYEGMTTISRDNWAEADAGISRRNLTLSDADKAQADKKGREASRNPDWNTPVASVKTNSGGTLKLNQFIEKDYSDPQWQQLVEQLTPKMLEDLYSQAGYATKALDYIGKPRAVDSDGPAGIQSFVGGASAVEAYGYPTETLLACSWNVELAERLGKMVGEDGLIGGVSGWYAPAMDTHRTPFGGRNFEYYSEDGLLAGKMGASVVSGAQSKGLYCFIKHFALNEQDTNRGMTLHTWANEQSMREVYFVPFQISVQEGGALALMTSLNCIGVTPAVGNYELITKLLKEEWGFEGMVITDYLGYDAQLIEQVLFAGGDAMLSTFGMFSSRDNQAQAQLQRAAKNICYTVSRSNAMLNIDEGGGVSAGIPVYQVICWCVVGVLAIGLIVADVFVVVLPLIKNKKANREV